MIKAIIFDCFGVLTTDLWKQFKDQHFSDKPDLFHESSVVSRQADRGVINYNDFRSRIAAMAGVSAADVDFLPSKQATNKLLFNYIAENLKQKYQLAILSNASENFLDQMFAPEQIELFEQIILSCDVGMCKPQPGFYKLAATRLSVQPGECVFVDDRQLYADAAQKVGMHGICYENLPQFKNDLSTILSH